MLGRIVVVALMSMVLAAPASAEYDEAAFFAKAHPSYTIPTPGPHALPAVIGEVQIYRVRKGDTLMDLARLYGLGYNEIVEANPEIDPWVPPVGATVLLPTQWILPCCSYSGVIVNIPEMRLFYYQPGPEGMTIVHTYPVGLGRDDWRTPAGSFRIAGKTVNPTWNIPASIREEHIRERGDYRTSIPGGDPDNPLGKYRFELTMPMYRIHGTNIPWGVGMQVSHGCIRLYPEDIERLFPLVPVGAPGQFTYQTVKLGSKDNAVWAEVHEDIYGYTPAIFQEAENLAAKRGVGERVDRGLLERGLQDAGGMPFRISGTQQPSPDAATPMASRDLADGAADTLGCQARAD
ncbi:MAG: L,D-transpeptidase family protein [bacterium]|nr:L,D-transpeptidase family protein [bacterium]